MILIVVIIMSRRLMLYSTYLAVEAVISSRGSSNPSRPSQNYELLLHWTVQYWTTTGTTTVCYLLLLAAATVLPLLLFCRCCLLQHRAPR